MSKHWEKSKKDPRRSDERDETGRTLFTQTGDFTKGYNAIALERSIVNTTGLLYYKLETANDSAVKKMIQTK